MLDHNFSPTRSMRNDCPGGINGLTTEGTEGVQRSFAPGKYAGLRMTRLG
jgi:hypothetical protein